MGFSGLALQIVCPVCHRPDARLPACLPGAGLVAGLGRACRLALPDGSDCDQLPNCLKSFGLYGVTNIRLLCLFGFSFPIFLCASPCRRIVKITYLKSRVTGTGQLSALVLVPYPCVHFPCLPLPFACDPAAWRTHP